MYSPTLLLLLATASLSEARSLHDIRHLHRRQADSTVLSPQAVQSGSSVDGTQQVGANVAAQAASKTSQNNFINNCVGKTLTNGFQIVEGSCNGIIMGDIPSKDNMVSSIIVFPESGSATIQSDTTFNISVQVTNLVAGSFTNADATYYSAPQQLQGGKIVGHTHVTVQDLGTNLNPTSAMDPTLFSFFKGINDDGNGEGLLSATVTGGLPAGNYRVCTMSSASNHQPVLMPVAQRGSSDDCTKFTVIGSGTTKNDAANDGVKGIAAAALAQSAVDAGPGFVSVSSSAAATATGKVVDDGSGVVSTSAVTTKAAATSAVATSVGAPFSNSTTTRGRGGNNGGKVTSSTTIAKAVSSTTKTLAAVQTSQAAGVATTKTRGSGNGATKVETAVSGKPTGKRIITIIETFFIFNKFRGGACPAVGKNGDKFTILEDLFDDLASAAQAACGQQFTTCVSFEGPGFSVEECQSQKDDCAAVASTQSATATTPSTQTASITIPITATATVVPGSVIATQTIAPTSVASSAAGNNNAVATQTLGTSSESSCLVVTQTVTVDAPATTSTAPQTTSLAVLDDSASSVCSVVTGTVTVDAPAITSSSSVSALPTLTSSKAPFSNSTATATTLSAASSTASSSTAIGGIAAPAILDTGDASRPFSVNGNTFANKAAAVQRSCDVQFNKCANAINGGTLKGFTLADCSAQQTTCSAQ